MIFHITEEQTWQTAQQRGAYVLPSLNTEGFIHCSTHEQLIPVANFLFRGRTDLVLLCINESEVESEIRYENLEGGGALFPHIYGSLNLDAIAKAVDFRPMVDGSFAFPVTGEMAAVSPKEV